ncbi:sugar phosphate isomerase/epimerase [Lewinella aquimaris]|uniref:Sugar phosphate isomerase/epimerase n=1 Tax=Neolewinella aquimaris TaxID=1835722 RepID=A0A840E1Y3_9BACT|nr:sugar phosphate isomerase/epimerase family protein [Neolewinella aquimaris]MBB4077762.1 sugar phosphate isomerase/epimerase [Neolewinella aquimaris]
MRKLLLLFTLCITTTAVTAQSDQAVIPEVGIVNDLENDSLIGSLGFGWLTEATPKILSPRTVSDEEFATLLPKIKSLQVPLYACNIFIPRELKVVGPDVDEAAVLEYVEIVFQRARAAGLSLITWGSGGSREVPDGFSRLTATAQFIYMAKRVAEVAAEYDILLALENLNSTECNFITTLPEALAVVKAVDHPNLRLCVDIYHMLMERESADAIKGTGPYAIYCEIAERKDRAAPGVNGQYFTPYFSALKDEGYTGKIMIEARWKDLALQGETALETLRQQLAEAY